MKLFYIVFFCMMSTVVSAQRENKPVQLSHYVLDSFSRGKVQVKSGTVSDQTLNYNVLTGEMIFNDGGRFMAIGNPENVDTVFIHGRRFIPVDKKFYEILTGTSVLLLMEYTCKIDEPGVSVGYGNASATTNATTFTSLVRSGGVYDIKLPDDFKITPVTNYWILKDGNYQKANSLQQLNRIFPDKKDFIKQFFNKVGTSISNKEDIISLIQELQ